MERRGSFYWGILLYLILGVMILMISFYFIFNEGILGNDGEREGCRQSILARAAIPDGKYQSLTLYSLKDEFPLKCKTDVKEIEKSDVVDDMEGAKRIIAESIAECWYLFGKGDSDVFPSRFYKDSTCVPCARIHLTDDAREYLEDKGITNISIREALDLKMEDTGARFYAYLQNSGDKFSAFSFGNTLEFDSEGDGFKVEEVKGFLANFIGVGKSVDLVNRMNGGETTLRMRSTYISLPKSFFVDKGDLIISYGAVTIYDDDFGNYVPYLFYFQTGDGKPFEEVQKDFIFNFRELPWDLVKMPFDFIEKEGDWDELTKRDVGFCEGWEGIPG